MMDYNKKENYVKFPKINQPLHFEYVNYAELYLPGKLAYQYAKKFENIILNFTLFIEKLCESY